VVDFCLRIKREDMLLPWGEDSLKGLGSVGEQRRSGTEKLRGESVAIVGCTKHDAPWRHDGDHTVDPGGQGGQGGMWGFGGGGNGFGSSGVTGWQIENSQKSGNGGMWGMGSSLKAPNWLLGMWKDSHYQSELKKRWAELRSGVWHTKTMDAYLDSMKIYLKNAADRNFKRWPNLGKASGQNDTDPEPMKYCNSQSGGFGMAMGGYNATTWDGEFEHLRKKMKERIAWMDQQLGFSEPANPIVTEPVIHDPD